MALFKKKLSLDDILEGINNLSEDEKGKVMAMLGENPNPAEETPEVENVEEPASNDEPVNEPAEEVEEGPEEPSNEESGEVAEENSESEEATDTVTEEPVVSETENLITEQAGEVENKPEEPVAEVAPEVQKQNEEQDDAQNARMQAIEEKVAIIDEKLEQILASLDNKDFGLNPDVPEGGGEDHNRMSAVMRSYAGGNANRYF